jgi:hypothetical protein
MRYFREFALFSIAAFLISACNDSTSFGLDLLNEDTTKVGFSDTLLVQSATITGDLAEVYSPFTAASAYLCGRMNDPVFGKSSASIYMQVLPQQGLFYDFKDKAVDSIVWVLPYDTTAFYGNLKAPITFNIYPLAEQMDRTNTYNSNASFATEPIPIGTVTVTPTFASTQVFDYRQGTIDTLKFPQIRIPINKATFLKPFAQADSTNYTSDADFFKLFKGAVLRPADNSQAIVGINLQSNYAGLYFYYNGSTSPGQFQYVTNGYSAKLSSFEHDFTNAKVKSVLDKPFTNDGSTIYTQAMAGVLGAIKVPEITKLKGKIINFAELELYIETIKEDNTTYFPPASQIILYYKNSSGNYVVTSDVIVAGEEVYKLVGGNPIAGVDGNPGKYRVNLSTHLNKMVDGKVPSEIFIRVFPRSERAARTTFYGAGHTKYGTKLKITYTELPK